MDLLYGSVEAVMVPVMRHGFRMQLDGLERLPSRGPCLIAANHLSLMDPFVLGFALHEAGLRGRFLAKAELFRNPALRALLKALGQIPVHRRTERAAQALEHAEAALWRRQSVCVFPEGTVGPGLPLLPLKTGVVRLSIATGVSVIPVAIWGSQHIFPAGSRRPRLRLPIRLCVGEALPPVGTRPTEDHVEEMTSRLAVRLAGMVATLSA